MPLKNQKQNMRLPTGKLKLKYRLGIITLKTMNDMCPWRLEEHGDHPQAAAAVGAWQWGAPAGGHSEVSSGGAGGGER